jgi:eukaryotic-like serine/threonine-protein kinase
VSPQQAGKPEPTEIAGRYQVVQKLGAGAFGTVYKAKDRILGRMVAIKTIRLEGLAAAGTSLDQLMDRFKREAQISAQLKHPNIVTIYDVGEVEGTSYLAMEFIDGIGLDRAIAGAGSLSTERAAGLGAQVADALDFAHRHNVVHRDIKPANIMIEGGDRVKVTDFGIAKVTDSADHLTQTGSLLGTPSYMSPEQARGGELDGRSDLFAVGCILYEMITGKKAFRGDSITGLIFKIITEEPPPLHGEDPDIPAEMVRIIAKCLAKLPDQRYQSGRELADDLLALSRPGTSPTLRQTEVATAPGSWPPRPAAPPTIQYAPTVAAAAPTRQVTLTPAVGKAIPPAPMPEPPGRAARPAPAAAVAAPPPPAKSKMGVILGALAAGLLVIVGAGAALGWYFFVRKPDTAADAGRVNTAAPPPAAVTAPPATMAADPAGTLPDAAAPPVAAAPITAPPTMAPAGIAPGAGPANRPAAAPGPVAEARPGAAAPAPRTPTREPAQTAAESGARSSYSVLDEEPASDADGREAGEALADKFRSGQGSRTSGGFGASGRFRARERSPRDLTPVERPAVATIRHLIDREEAFHRREGRYANFADLGRSGPFLDVPTQNLTFQRRGYRFELTVESDGFRIVAEPMAPGPRSFVGDDSGFIRAGID